jgi:hypothetical protein
VPSRLLLVSLAQNAVLFAVVIALGLLAARAAGLGAPYIDAVLGGRTPDHPVREVLVWSIGLGAAAGLFMLALDLFLIPLLPALLALARKTSLWENFTASFYGGLNEELLFRLLGLSVIAWLLSRVWHTPSREPTDAVFWSTNVIMAVLFGLGHLPAARAVTASITPLLVGRTLAMNGPIALVCGWLFWRFGIEAASSRTSPPTLPIMSAGRCCCGPVTGSASCRGFQRWGLERRLAASYSASTFPPRQARIG